jgi:chemotaxis methyl-accepting protein methylase
MESAGIHKLRHYLDLVQVDPVSLERAEAGSYPESSLRELPAALRRKYFRREGNMYRICEAVRRSVQFRKLDLLRDPPSGRFDLILCRNAAFTYFNPVKRLAVAGTFATALQERGHRDAVRRRSFGGSPRSSAKKPLGFTRKRLVTRRSSASASG